MCRSGGPKANPAAAGGVDRQRKLALPFWRRGYQKDLSDEFRLALRAGLLKNELEVLAGTGHGNAELPCRVGKRVAGSEELGKPRLTRRQAKQPLKHFCACLLRPLGITDIDDGKRLIGH